MARDLTPAFEAATLAPVVRPILLVEALFDSAPARLWSGYGTLSWSGRSWSGAGNLLGLGMVEESTEIRATGIDISLSGIPVELLSLALNENYQGRTLSAWIGAMDTNTSALVGDPYAIFVGRMDVMTIGESAELATIAVTAESRMIDLERPRERRYDHEDQIARYPGDMFFEFVPGLQDTEIVWGRDF